MMLKRLITKIKYFFVCPVFMSDIEEMDFEI